MKQETIDYAVKVLKRHIKFYRRTINRQKDSSKAIKFRNYESNMAKYEIILADLKAIKKAISNNETEVEIRGTVKNSGYMYPETSRTVEKAGFDIDGDGYGMLYLSSMKEMEEEWEKEMQEM